MANRVSAPKPVPTTRDQVLDVAERLAQTRGFNGFSYADIAAELKVTKASLHYHFPSKTDLLAAVLDLYREGIGPMLLEPAWAGVEDPIEKVFALLARYRKSLADTDCFYGCPIGSLALELHEPDPAVRERLAKNFEAWIEAVAHCLLEAKSRLPADQNLRELAQFVLTTMEGGVMQARTFRDINYFDAAVRQLRQYFKGLVKREKHHAKREKRHA